MAHVYLVIRLVCTFHGDNVLVRRYCIILLVERCFYKSNPFDFNIYSDLINIPWNTVSER